MKFFIAFAALVAVAVASPLVKPVSSDLTQMEAIIAAIQSPNTDPATAALLEQQLQDILVAANPEPVIVGPAVIEPEPIAVGPAVIEPEPIAVGPAVIDFPLPDGGVASSPVVQPSPVVVGPIADGAASPLVQIILNINGQSVELIPGVAPVRPDPAGAPVRPDPVGLVPVEPVQVVEVAPVPAEPVQVIEVAPVPVEPVIIGTPVLPSPAVVLPEELN